MAQAFFGGVHPHDMKAATNEKAIEQLAPPAVVVIPMSMHFGAPCTPLVKAGDHVKVGQKIGEFHDPCQRVRHGEGGGAPSLFHGRQHHVRGHRE